LENKRLFDVLVVSDKEKEYLSKKFADYRLFQENQKVKAEEEAGGPP